MGQTGRPDHQRQSDQEQIQCCTLPGGVGTETQVGHHPVQFLEEGDAAGRAAQTDLGDGAVGELQ